jgi:hypothetical protein
MCIVQDRPRSHSTPAQEMISVDTYRVILHCFMMEETLNKLIPNQRSPEEYLQEYWITSYKNIQKISAKNILRAVDNSKYDINTRPQTWAKRGKSEGIMLLF